MSYFVIKGPHDSGSYLCSMPDHETPQWYSKKEAIKFPDADSAWKFMETWCRNEYPRLGRVVRINTTRDWKAERAQLRAYTDQLRLHLELKEMVIKGLQARVNAREVPPIGTATGK
jgi:predicted NAD-dependent protein-ADP-ribosyltransferase YbiA (DUF1768 family)